MLYRSVNPLTKKVVRSFEFATEAEVSATLQKSWDAFDSYRTTTIESRKEKVINASNLLRERSDSLARLMSEEMGKPITQGRAEIEKCAAACEWFASHALTELKPTKVKTEATQTYIAYQPLGPLYVIMPWNFPFWLPIKAGIP